MTKLFSARFLLAGFILLLLALLVLVVVNNMRGSQVAVVKEILRSEDDLSMQQLNYTETRNGVRKWTVQAESASHNLKQESARLENLTLTVFNPSSSDLKVTSSTGRLDLRNRQVLLRGDVILQAASGETVYTDELWFIDNDQIVKTDQPVRLVADGYTVSGEGMRFDVTSRNLVLLSQVKAVYKEGLNVK
jgi:LPS export ABC transporter protein LptC